MRVIQATWDDVPHLSAAAKNKLWSEMPPHEREARSKGVPALGSGRVFPLPEASIVCDAVPIPKHWVQIVGVDFGWDHPFAATRCAWDRDPDIFYVTAAYRQKEAVPAIHAASVRPWGTWIPVSWPHDGLQHDKGSGDQLAAQYREHGLNMLPEHATHEEGGNGLEAGVMEMLERMQTGRFKVFAGLEDWLGEFRLYHRDNGRIVKERDDLISSSRYALMMRRFAETERVPIERRVVTRTGWMG